MQTYTTALTYHSRSGELLRSCKIEKVNVVVHNACVQPLSQPGKSPLNPSTHHSTIQLLHSLIIYVQGSNGREHSRCLSYLHFVQSHRTNMREHV